jgi:hypothetical protein
MGIGAAFVTGLVQGFAKNIEVEKAKRLSDQQKLDTLETTLAEYRMKPADERSASGLNAVAEALRGARGEVASRGRVNLFGQRSPGLDIDIANMKGLIDEVDTSEFSFGRGDNRVSFRTVRPKDFNTATAWAGEFAAKMQDENFRGILRKDRDVWSGVSEVINAYNGYMNGRALENPGPDNEILTYDETTESWWNDWNGINSGWLDSGKAGQGSGVSAGEALRKQQAEEKNNPNILGITRNGRIIDYSQMSGPIFSTDNMVAGFNDIKNAFNLRDNGDVFNVWHRNIAIAGVTNEVANQWFDASVKLGAIQQDKFPRLDLLRPQNIMTLSEDAREASSIPSAYNIVSSVLPLNASGQPSLQAAAHALYPYFMMQEKEPQYVAGKYRVSRDNKSRTELALELHYGDENPTGKTFGDIEQALVNEERVLTDIRSLAVKTVQLGDAAAYQEVKQIFRFTGSVIKSGVTDLGFLDQLGLTAGQREAIQMVDSGSGEPGITQDFLDTLGKEMEDAKKRDNDPLQARADGVTYAEIASLRIGLAFKMARAADPSGRLSNQDVQQQLDRLGSNFNTPTEVVKKLGVVIQEFEDRADRLRVLVKYGKGSRPMKPEERAIMEAAYSFDIMRRYGRKSAGSAASIKSYNTPLTVSSMVTQDGQPVVKLFSGPDLDATAKKDADGMDILHTVSQDADGNPVYTPISPDQLKRADTNAAPPSTSPMPVNTINPDAPSATATSPTPVNTINPDAASSNATSPMPVNRVNPRADIRTQPPAFFAETRPPEDGVEQERAPANADTSQVPATSPMPANRVDPPPREIPDMSQYVPATERREIPMFEELPPAPEGGIPVDDASPVGPVRPGGKFEIRIKGGDKMEGLYIVQNGYYVPAGDLM